MLSYDIKAFLDSIQDEDYPDILRSGEEATRRVESRSYGVKGAVKARKEGSVEYAMALKRFLFFMRSGTKPAGISDWEFKLYRPVCEALVRKGWFKPEVLKMFDGI